MFTPIDLQNKTFSKAAFGYKKDEVEAFIDEIVAEFEKIYRENLEYKDKINILNDALQNYKGMEDALKNTLMFAQNTAEDVKKNAKDQAEITILEAKNHAENLVREADAKVFEAERQLTVVKNQIANYKAQFESVLESQKRMLEDIK